MKSLILVLLRIYRYLLSPWVGGSCRYWPTCSEYAREAVEVHGAGRGSYLAVARLVRCHPYGAGGVDPVPERFRWRCWCAEPIKSDDGLLHPAGAGATTRSEQ